MSFPPNEKEPNPLVLTLARNLRSRRRALGLTQESFATRCGLHRTYIGAIERGERNITLATLKKLADQLSLEPTELLVSSED